MCTSCNVMKSIEGAIVVPLAVEATKRILRSSESKTLRLATTPANEWTEEDKQDAYNLLNGLATLLVAKQI